MRSSQVLITTSVVCGSAAWLQSGSLAWSPERSPVGRVYVWVVAVAAWVVVVEVSVLCGAAAGCALAVTGAASL